MAESTSFNAWETLIDDCCKGGDSPPFNLLTKLDADGEVARIDSHVGTPSDLRGPLQSIIGAASDRRQALRAEISAGLCSNWHFDGAPGLGSSATKKWTLCSVQCTDDGHRVVSRCVAS